MVNLKPIITMFSAMERAAQEMVLVAIGGTALEPMTSQVGDSVWEIMHDADLAYHVFSLGDAIRNITAAHIAEAAIEQLGMWMVGQRWDVNHRIDLFGQRVIDDFEDEDRINKGVQDALFNLKEMYNAPGVDKATIVTIPDNDDGVPRGRYTRNELVTMLRENKAKPEIIQFIADMLEE